MATRVDPSLVAWWKSWSRVAGVVVSLVGGLVLVGWGFDLAALKGLWPGLATMKPNTALSFLLAGVSVWLAGREPTPLRRRFSQAGAAFVTGLALLTLSQDLFGWNLGIDQRLFQDSPAQGSSAPPGRMSPATAFNFILLGSALLLLEVKQKTGWWAAQLLALLAGMVALLALAGYLYNVQTLYQFLPFSSMALHTVLTFFSLVLAILAARPDQGIMAPITGQTIGGLMLRRLLPAALVLPLALGWVRLQGQRMDLYDTEMGLAIFALSNVIIFTGLIWWNARLIDRVDLKRELAEAAVQISEHRFRALIENSADAISLVSAKGIILYESPASYHILGYPAEQRIGQPGFQRVHPDDLEEATDAFGQLLQNPDESVRIQVRLQHQDGSWRWIEAVAANLLAKPSVRAIVVNFRDVTERKQVEEDLRENEERFRATFEQAAVGMAHLGLNGRWLRVNQKLGDIVGYSREELLEKTFQEITHPDDLPRDLALVRQVLAGEIPSYSLEKRYIHKDGSIVWGHLTVAMVRKPSDEPKHLVSVIQDITQHKRLEEQFRQTQKMEAIGRLSGGVAHDFNNLLVVINGYSELLLQRYLPEDHPARKYIKEIEKAGQRAAALTGQLLAFSRQQILQPQVLNLNEVVAEMEQMLRRLIGEDIELMISSGQSLGQVKADPGQLQQVIMNLVVNARDAMPQGGKLLIETANAELDELYAGQHLNVTPGLYVMVAVSDTGMGMDAEIRSHIFEPFFTTKEQGKGTGLGLATVYGLVKQSGGDIWVYSEPGQGTTFKIYLPQVEEMVSTSEPRPGLSTLPPGEETVLLVEDEEAVRHLVHQSLEMNGYTVLVASQGAEALSLGEQHRGPIHLLVTDVVMPGGMNGRNLAEQLKSLRPGLKVLFMSGYTDEAIVHHGVLEPGLFLLQKPFTPNILLRKVREVLDAA